MKIQAYLGTLSLCTITTTEGVPPADVRLEIVVAKNNVKRKGTIMGAQVTNLNWQCFTKRVLVCKISRLTKCSRTGKSSILEYEF